MFIVNTDYIPGKELELLGLVKGATIQTRHMGKDIGAGLKTIVGGELKGYTEMMDSARRIATERMQQEAAKLGADAVINVRFATAAIMQGAAEVMAYGTAVKFL
ncbi:MAG: YbjQ family protein [Firmicutes bacterium]|nr:YbjQ family protein [Bacillota bacterium]